MGDERTAPLGRLWATPGDLPHQHAISREFALDSGLPDPEQYPSWPNYPDERNLPVAFEARARWKVRLAKITADKKPRTTPKTETADKTPDMPFLGAGGAVLLKCVCGKLLKPPTRGPTPKFCSDACRKAASRA